MLEIDNLGEDEKLFTFKYDLQGWAKNELNRKQLTNMESAYLAIKNLTYYREIHPCQKGQKGSQKSKFDSRK